ncbi:VWA domain-containing protein [Siccirubricoccus sp. KC 17139]|uniref:VWA domain-containing protein n=1 Tax=Siccirubricoccus soli TaxID=2899147 RepID=A0ABT1D8C0_9PROT|nr:vWA domain-containing protein [Siccirubricoccus soli]MCO6417505.1 VWA domain-containing protein [Siccirubricoccus soli]MCP2683640.1 VWA domain-containing protein [Siccirubricoccus soli]
MMLRRLLPLLLLPALLPGAALAQPADPWRQGGGGQAGRPAPLLVPGKRSLYQRVLLRPGATLHQAPGGPGRPALGFSAFFVYAKQGRGAEEWLQIGPAPDGRTEGWVQAARTVEWNHGMVAAFTNPANRGRGLFMETEAGARALLNAGGAAEAQRLRTEAAAGRPAPGVLALEPANHVDITQQFYLLPILNAATVEREIGGPVRVLEVASAPEERPPQPQQAAADPLANFRAGLVFVVDTTISMQPYIDATREAMTGIVGRLRQTALRDKFRFGVVGYRDSKEATPQGYEYTARTFAKPDFGQPPDASLSAMQGLVASTGGNEGFDEDPVAGLATALDEVDWASLGGRYLMLITDAGGRDAADPLSATRQGFEEIAQRARAAGVVVMVVHLLTPEGRTSGNHSRARRQYLGLAANGNTGDSLYFGVENGAPEAFRGTVSALVEGILRQVSATTGVSLEALRGAGGGQVPQREAQRIEAQMRIVGEAMRLAYLGREQRTTAPDVVRSFVLDRDPAPPGIAAIDVRVLLTRNQLEDLSKTLEEILRAGRATRLQPREFFGQLQSAMAVAARDPSRIALSGALGGLLGEFLEGLPYNSEIMAMTEREWNAMSAGAQARLLNQVEAKLRLYRDFARSNLWTTLSGRREAGEQVFPVPLDALP